MNSENNVLVLTLLFSTLNKQPIVLLDMRYILAEEPKTDLAMKSLIFPISALLGAPVNAPYSNMCLPTCSAIEQRYGRNTAQFYSASCVAAIVHSCHTLFRRL